MTPHSSTHESRSLPASQQRVGKSLSKNLVSVLVCLIPYVVLATAALHVMTAGTGISSTILPTGTNHTPPLVATTSQSVQTLKPTLLPVEYPKAANATDSTNTTSTKPWKYFPWKLPQNHQTIPANQQSQWAVMVISMGPMAAKFRIVERIWLSVRRRGDFFGPIVVLTDAAPDRYLGIQEVDPLFVQIQPQSSDYNWDTSFVDEAMPYKRFKTYLTEYLNNDARLKSVEYILYLDADVVVGTSLGFWLDFCKSQLSNTTMSTMASPSMLFFQGNVDSMPIQSGQFALHRHSAQSCLERWRVLIDSYPNLDKDQYSLKTLKEESRDDCHMKILPQEPWLSFVKKDNIHEVVSQKRFTTMMHIQNTGHARYMEVNVVKKLFQKLLNLTPEEASLNWKAPFRPSREWSRRQVLGQSGGGKGLVKHEVADPGHR